MIEIIKNRFWNNLSSTLEHFIFKENTKRIRNKFLKSLKNLIGNDPDLNYLKSEITLTNLPKNGLGGCFYFTDPTNNEYVMFEFNISLDIH